MRSKMVWSLACAALLLGTAVSLRAQDAAAEDTAKKLLGTWRMVSQKNADAQEYTNVPAEKARIKLLVPGGMAWVEFETNTGKVLTCVAGTWSAQGTEYKEKATAGMGGAWNFLKEKDPTFTCRLDGNRWNHTGTIDTWKGDENWEQVAAAQESDDKELAGKLVGVWRLVAASEAGGEEPKEIPKEKQTSFRYVTPTYALDVGYDPDTKLVNTCTGGAWSLAAGRMRGKMDCALTDEALAMRGKEMSLTCQVAGDRWQESLAVGDVNRAFVWERVKQ